MNVWPRKVHSYTREEVRVFCVLDGEWQEFRRSLKGLPTKEKLSRLDWRYKVLITFGDECRRYEVQVDNYLNALKRGGQLDKDYAVKREL